MSGPAPAAADAPAIAARPARSGAVDLLRGLTVLFMIMANNNGGEDALGIFKHADWNGCTPTDLVFPTFLFVVGISIVFATDARRSREAAQTTILLHAFRRFCVLVLLGIVVNSFPFFHLETMRFYGVLQRIGLCYFVATALYLFVPDWRRVLCGTAAALLVYAYLMCFVTVPGYGRPGIDMPVLDPDANLAAFIDRSIFSAAHLYERTRDPEGLLSTLPALATTLIGVLAGIWLRTRSTDARRLRGLALAGIACVLLGLLWSYLGFPINKKLWTSSYVLFAGGWSLLLLASFGALDRLRAHRSKGFTVLEVFGTNAIAAYMFSELLASALWSIRLHDDSTLAQWIADHVHLLLGGALGAFAYCVCFTFVCWLVAFALWRRRIFIRI